MSSITYHQGNAYFKTTVGCYVLYIRMPLWKMEKKRLDKEKIEVKKGRRVEEEKEGYWGEGKRGRKGRKDRDVETSGSLCIISGGIKCCS